MMQLPILVITILSLSSYSLGSISSCLESIANNPPGICPTWYKYIEEERRCICAGSDDTQPLIKCEYAPNITSLNQGDCVSYNETSKLTFVGHCPYNTRKPVSPFIMVSSDVFKLNNELCGPLNRTGLLCSQCQPGLGPAVFSKYRECLECMDQPYGWLLYLARVIIPMTLFCVVVIIFRINIASPSLNGFVIAAQVFITSFNNESFIAGGRENYYSVSKFVVTCYGFLNLDIFTYIIPSFCISEGMSMLTVLALQYTVALYPIMFTIVVYWCITLHDRGCKILVHCWRPFHQCFSGFRRSWELKGSVVNAFATFILLSYVKLCSISFQLIQTVTVWDICGRGRQHLYYEASYDSLSKQHIPYVILASIIIAFFIVLPTIFILFYQNKFFQKCLGICKLKIVLIHELANITQGSFKNGTSPGTRDYRWFAGFYLLIRVILVYCVNQPYSKLVYIIAMAIMTFMVATIQPYRSNTCNVVDSFFWLNWTIGTAWYVYHSAFNNVWRGLPFVLGSVPLVYFFCHIVRYIILLIWSWYVTRVRHNLVQRQDKLRNDEQLPDRLLNPKEYTPLIRPNIQDQ